MFHFDDYPWRDPSNWDDEGDEDKQSPQTGSLFDLLLDPMVWFLLFLAVFFIWQVYKCESG